jgi:hypothetical protein
MYKLFLDKPELFSCEISVKNANIKNSMARLIVESDNLNLVFKGKIENGKCSIPIRKLKGLMEENTKGNMHLEVIVEDTFFKPWESEYVVEEHTAVKVMVKEQVEEKSNKPIVEVKMASSPTKKISVPAREISQICERFGIDKNNYNGKRKKDFKQVVTEYFKINPEFNKRVGEIIKESVSSLS